MESSDKNTPEVVSIGHPLEEAQGPTPDFEFMVIATCIDAFSKLDKEAVNRVLTYLTDRYLAFPFAEQGRKLDLKEESRRGPRKN